MYSIFLNTNCSRLNLHIILLASKQWQLSYFSIAITVDNLALAELLCSNIWGRKKLLIYILNISYKVNKVLGFKNNLSVIKHLYVNCIFVNIKLIVFVNACFQVKICKLLSFLLMSNQWKFLKWVNFVVIPFCYLLAMCDLILSYLI